MCTNFELMDEFIKEESTSRYEDGPEEPGEFEVQKDSSNDELEEKKPVRTLQFLLLFSNVLFS